MLVKNKSGSEKTPFGQVWNEFRTSYLISQCIQAIIVLLGALLILDYYDIPSWILQKMTEYPLFVVVVVVICGCIFLLAWALRFLHLISVLKFKLVSGADSAFLIAAIALLVYGIVRFTVWKFKYIGLSVFALSAISAFCFGGRMLFLTKVKKDANQYKSNLVDLKDVYLNQFQYKPGEPIQIEETDVD